MVVVVVNVGRVSKYRPPPDRKNIFFFWKKDQKTGIEVKNEKQRFKIMHTRINKLSTQQLRRLIELRFELEKLLKQVCYLTEFSVDDLKGKSKYRDIAYVRGAYACVARSRHPDASLDLIGSILNRDHSSVSIMIKQVREVKEKQEHYIWLRTQLKNEQRLKKANLN